MSQKKVNCGINISICGKGGVNISICGKGGVNYKYVVRVV